MYKKRGTQRTYRPRFAYPLKQRGWQGPFRNPGISVPSRNGEEQHIALLHIQSQPLHPCEGNGNWTNTLNQIAVEQDKRAGTLGTLFECKAGTARNQRLGETIVVKEWTITGTIHHEPVAPTTHTAGLNAPVRILLVAVKSMGATHEPSALFLPYDNTVSAGEGVYDRRPLSSLTTNQYLVLADRTYYANDMSFLLNTDKFVGRGINIPVNITVRPNLPIRFKDAEGTFGSCDITLNMYCSVQATPASVSSNGTTNSNYNFIGCSTVKFKP